MKRRDVIKLGAMAAGAGAGVPGCALPRMLASLTGRDGAAAFGAMLDAQLAPADGPGFVSRWVAAERKEPNPPELEAKLAEKDALFRRLIGTLLVTQGFRELPEETQLQPAVQERMWRHMDDIDATVFEVSDMLASLDTRGRNELQRTLRERPDLPMKLGEALDDSAASAGISARRRLQLRTMMAQSAFRLRQQNPVSVIDEYVAKVERLRASGETDARALRLSRELGERAFWKQQHLLAQHAAAPGGAGPPSGSNPPSPDPLAETEQPPAVTVPQARPSPQPPAQRRGEGGMKVGGYLLGIGTVVFGVSVALTSVEFGFVVGATVGAILFAIGLITLIVSAIVYAASGST